MKRIIASIVFIITFAVYAGYQHLVSASPTALAATGAATAFAAGAAASTASASGSSAPPSSASASNGQYKDGAYTGDAVSAYYGTVQVQAVIKNGRLANVNFLQYPSDRSTSQFINSQAMQGLAQEAVNAQSANVDGVSGATDTTMAFRQSLSTALSAAAA